MRERYDDLCPPEGVFVPEDDAPSSSSSGLRLRRALKGRPQLFGVAPARKLRTGRRHLRDSSKTRDKAAAMPKHSLVC